MKQLPLTIAGLTLVTALFPRPQAGRPYLTVKHSTGGKDSPVRPSTRSKTARSSALPLPARATPFSSQKKNTAISSWRWISGQKTVHAIHKNGQAGSSVYFKNIRIWTTGLQSTPFPKGVYVVNNVANSLTPDEENSGWHLLFDGRTSQGWIGAYKKAFPEKGWEIKNGIISVLASQDHGNLVRFRSIKIRELN